MMAPNVPAAIRAGVGLNLLNNRRFAALDLKRTRIRLICRSLQVDPDPWLAHAVHLAKTTLLTQIEALERVESMIDANGELPTP